ncbi:MAG: ATP-dependent DNA helicase [Nitrospinota bacterium]|nr:MAG: ATP-dependent DNA helicase [Nitrospinota bacterium]
MEKIFGPGGLLAQRLPGYEERPEQLTMSQWVWEALQERKTLIIEAATGTGKTLAYLVPAILSGLKVVISTGTKNLQDQIYFKDIPLLQRLLPRSFSACYMKGRENYLCLQRLDTYRQQLTLPAASTEHPIDVITRWSQHTRTGDRAELHLLPDDAPLWREINATAETCLGSPCAFFHRCFLTQMRQRAAEADLIVVNHHLFCADLAVRDTNFGEVIPSYDAVIFDEAHLLDEVATHYFGLSASSYQFETLLRDTEQRLRLDQVADRLLFTTLETLYQLGAAFFATMARQGDRVRLPLRHPGEPLLPGVTELIDALVLLASQIQNLSHPSEELRSCARRSLSLAETLRFITEREDRRYVYWCERRGQGMVLQAAPIDVGEDLRRRLFSQSKPIILTSATLAVHQDFSFVRDRLGIDKADEIILPSPFDYARQTLLYLPTHLPDPRSPAFVDRITAEIHRLLQVTAGRALVLFTSYRNMHEVYQRLHGTLPYRLLLQGERPKNLLLEEFKQDISSVLFATSSFWQGIDVQGEALTAVIIDKLPFTAPSDPLTEARIELLLTEKRNPFLEYQIPAAIITLKQGLGRLIRNRRDRGVLAILDKRLLTKTYGRFFLESLPPCPITHELDDLARFLKQEGERP